MFCGVTISGFVLAPGYSAISATVGTFNTAPLANRGSFNVANFPIFTPGIKFIKLIAPFIRPIALLIAPSINEITPFIPLFTALDIAFPIFVPKLLNVFLILFHIQNF